MLRKLHSPACVALMLTQCRCLTKQHRLYYIISSTLVRHSPAVKLTLQRLQVTSAAATYLLMPYAVMPVTSVQSQRTAEETVHFHCITRCGPLAGVCHAWAASCQTSLGTLFPHRKLASLPTWLVTGSSWSICCVRGGLLD